MPDTLEMVSHEEDLTTVPEPVIHNNHGEGFEAEPPDVFDGQSVDPSIRLHHNSHPSDRGKTSVSHKQN